MSTPTNSVTIQALGAAALLSKTSVSIPAAGIVQIQTTALDSQGNASGQRVNLTSSNTGVARVSGSEVGYANANVAGVAPGTATITATASDNANAVATLTVTVV